MTTDVVYTLHTTRPLCSRFLARFFVAHGVD